MTNPNDSASDCTKLEHFAAMAMQGFIANTTTYHPDSAKESVMHALALIAELNKQESEQPDADDLLVKAAFDRRKFEVGDTVSNGADMQKREHVLARFYRQTEDCNAACWEFEDGGHAYESYLTLISKAVKP
jgi:hypothetical protein